MSRGDFQREPVEPLRSAMKAFAHTTGLTIVLTEQHQSGRDGKMTVACPNGRTLELVFDVKSKVDRRDQLSTFKFQHNGAVLITRPLSAIMADQCRLQGIQFLDSAGNCYLNQPGLFVLVSGQKDAAANHVATLRGLTPAALRLMFAVLGKPSLLGTTVRHIADIAAISHGAAGTALRMLEESGLIAKNTAGQRLLVAPGRWLDAWTEGYLGRLRPKLETYRMSSPVPLSSTLDRLSPALHEMIKRGGETAAANLELGLKPGALTLYIDMRQPEAMRNLVQELKLRRDPAGKIELVDIFWNTRELASFQNVPDALIYADLIGSGDERNLEIAATLKARIIDDVASKA